MAVPTRSVAITFKSAKKAVSTMTLYPAGATSAADVATNALAIRGRLADLTGLAIIKVQVTETIFNAPLAVPPDADADPEEKALLNFLNADGQIVQLSIPGAIDDIYTPGTKEVDPNHADLALFLGNIISQGWTDGDAVDIAQFEGGEQVFRPRKS